MCAFTRSGELGTSSAAARVAAARQESWEWAQAPDLAPCRWRTTVSRLVFEPVSLAPSGLSYSPRRSS